MPDADPAFVAALSERDVVVTVVSQCSGGRVDLSAYRTSAPLVAAGAIGGLDMTTEAAYAKLVVLLSEGRSADEVRALMTTDLAGELTPSPQTAGSPGTDIPDRSRPAA